MLTDRMMIVLEIVAQANRQKKPPPTVGELAQQIGATRYGIYDDLRTLEKLGLMSHKDRALRTWHSTDRGRQVLRDWHAAVLAT